MFSASSQKLIKTMTLFNTQLFGTFSEEKNDDKGRQEFIIASSRFLTSTFGSRARLIMESDKEAKGITSNVSARFSAYYLPAKINGLKEFELGNDSDIFVTDVLTGCTFLAVASEEKMKVYHINAQDEDGNIDQKKIDAMIMTLPDHERNNILFKLTKKDYEISKNPVSIVGIRSKEGHWSFHYQISERDSFTYVNTMNVEEKMDVLLGANDKYFYEKNMRRKQTK